MAHKGVEGWGWKPPISAPLFHRKHQMFALHLLWNQNVLDEADWKGKVSLPMPEDDF